MTTATNKRVHGKQINASETCEYLINTPIWGTKRQCKDSLDFGDKLTIGKHLKRRYINFHEYVDNLDFAIFLGEHEGKWVAGIKNEDGTRLVSGEIFDSLSDLKEAWQLD